MGSGVRVFSSQGGVDMKKLLIILLLASGAQAQERITPPSKYEKFLSDRGSMITKDYYNLPTLKGKYSSPDVQVVVLTSSAGKGYFYRIRMKTKYSDKTAVISRDDLTEGRRPSPRSSPRPSPAARKSRRCSPMTRCPATRRANAG